MAGGARVGMARAPNARRSARDAFRLRLRCLGAIADAVTLQRRIRRGDDVRSHTILSDARFAVRSLRRTPMFTAVVVATLALCIGATTSVFSIVESALLNGLGYRQIDRLVAVWSDNPQENNDHYQVSVGDYFDWRARTHSFAQLAGFFPSWNTLYSGPDGVERIDVGAVSANFLRTLGASPTIGRDFADGEDRRGAAGTVILSHEFWSRALQADPRVVGRTLTFDGKPYVVIGVMGSRFVFPESRVDVLLPLSVLGTYIDRREVHMLSVVGRLRDGVSLDAARREAAPIAAQLRAGARQGRRRTGHHRPTAARRSRGQRTTPDSHPLRRRLRRAAHRLRQRHESHVRPRVESRARSWPSERRWARSRRDRAAVARRERGHRARVRRWSGLGLAVVATRALSDLLPSSIALLGHVGVDAIGARVHADRERGGDTRVRHGAGIRRGAQHDAPDARRFGSPVAGARRSPDVPRPRRRRTRARARTDRGRWSSHQQLRATLRHRSGFPPRSAGPDEDRSAAEHVCDRRRALPILSKPARAGARGSRGSRGRHHQPIPAA